MFRITFPSEVEVDMNPVERVLDAEVVGLLDREAPALLLGQLSGQFATELLEKRRHATEVFLAIPRVVRRGRWRSAARPSSHHRVETDEVDGVLDAGAQLGVDPGGEVERLVAAV